jgi:hypothetical protein
MAQLHACSRCKRHFGDEAVCPFCGEPAPMLRLPDMPEWAVRRERPAPKYGGPPFRRPTTWIAILVTAALAVLVWKLLG